MPYDLSNFNLGDMLKSSLRLREVSSGAPTLETSAQRVCRFLYEGLRAPDKERACVLVRCYKTHPFGSLEPELQRFATRLLGSEESWPSMKCLTLMATVGQAAAWNSRFLSQGHRAVPLPSPEIVEKAPMIAQLIKELGLELSSLLEPSPDVVKALAGKRHGVFHVEDVFGSPYIPAQNEFVEKFGIRSCWDSAECSQAAICSRSFCSRPCTFQFRGAAIPYPRPECEEQLQQVQRDERVQCFAVYPHDTLTPT